MEGMNYTIQRLAGHNLELMRSLNHLFGTVFKDDESYHSAPPSDDYLTTFLAHDDNIVLVAVENGKVLGGLVAYVLRKFERDRSEVYLYDLAVDDEQQRRGIGTALVRRLQEVAGELGAYIVFVQADEGEDAVEFYRSLKPTEDLQTRNFDFPATKPSL